MSGRKFLWKLKIVQSKNHIDVISEINRMVMSLERSKVNFIHFKKNGFHIQPFEIERNFWIISIFGSTEVFYWKWTFQINNWPQKVKSRSTKVKWTLCSISKHMKISTKTISCATSCVCLPSERILIFCQNFEISQKFSPRWLELSFKWSFSK